MFVNEFTSSEDIEKYELKKIDKRFEFLGTVSARDWTVDRARGIYFRQVARAGGSESQTRNQLTFTLFWKGCELTVRLDLLEGSGGEGEPGWSHWRLASINGSNGLPDALRANRREILSDLKEALTAYQGGGAYSGNYASYSVTLDIDPGCAL